MSHLGYIIPRIVRRYLPSPITSMAKRLRIGMVPGFETRHPVAAADRYETVLYANGLEWDGKRVLILGYGGFFGLGVELLHRGARHVILVDPFARVDNQANRKLDEKYAPYLSFQGNQVIPKEDSITIVHAEIPDHDFSPYGRIDLFLSSSVLEHVSSLDLLVNGLSKITPPEGFHIHYVDLRDHYFQYPFEMLFFSERVWKGFLDPPSHLNRMRLWDYKDHFSGYFQSVKIEIAASDLVSFEQVKPYIRPEFLSGDDDLDCTTRIVITAAHPSSF